jgi:hypothetical protein
MIWGSSRGIVIETLCFLSLSSLHEWFAWYSQQYKLLVFLQEGYGLAFVSIFQLKRVHLIEEVGSNSSIFIENLTVGMIAV